MILTAETIQLDLVHPFRISRSTSAFKENVLISISDGRRTGIGEAAPSAYYREDKSSVHRALSSLAKVFDLDPFDLETITGLMYRTRPGDASARAAVDIALHDLIGQHLGIPLYRFLGLNPESLPLTSFTIGIDNLETIRRKVQEAEGFPILKIKMGTDYDLDILRIIRQETDATLRVDANAGWDFDQAVEMARILADEGVELIEQPLPPASRDDLRRLKELSPLPIILDESVLIADDIPVNADCGHGINIKLMKCGGLREALRLIHVARAHGMKVMLGCMIETSVSITAAAHLAPLADYVDLDGHLLIANDPFTGMTVECGRMTLPDRPGLGVRPA